MKKTYLLIVVIFIVSLVRAQSPPVVINDTLYPVFEFGVGYDTTFAIHVLNNDFDPEGDDVRILQVKNRAGQDLLDLTFTDSTILLSMSKLNVVEQVYDYQICEVNDSNSVSNWGHLYLNPCWDPEYPVARNDTIELKPGSFTTHNLLLNDYHPAGDSLFVINSVYGSITGDSTISIDFPFYIQQNNLIGRYWISDTNVYFPWKDIANLYINVNNNNWYDSLDINNINARFNCFGHHFWDFDSFAHFKVPNGSNVSSIFNQTLWVGGLDPVNNLHLAAERYRQNGTDFFHGPVSDAYDTAFDFRWHHIWKLNKSDIEYHKIHWDDPGYEAIPDILSWPGNGDVDLGQSERIAPFEDMNGNDIYEPMLGDAPQIKGDQALFFVFNDVRGIHTETEGIPLGIEIHAMAYAFDTPEDSALWNTVFLHYDIINRSDTSYHDMYLGLFTDTDLGYAWDDRIECDVENGMYFTFNGDEFDLGGYDNPGYGEHPPAQGIQFLGGPFLEPDGIDNPKFDILGNQIVDESINGLNFGDGIVDNERMGMTHFNYFNSGGSAWMNDPSIAPEYYNHLQCIWKDNTTMQYGGYGHATALAEGPDAKFMWPRDTDPYNWGTMGLWPNGGWNQNNYFWTEEIMGANPNDRRGMGSTGPFSLASGQKQSLDIALPWARDFDGTAWESALLLKERAAYIKAKFQNESAYFSVNPQVQNDNHLAIYPNPASYRIHLETDKSLQFPDYEIIDVYGNVFSAGKLSNATSKFDLNVSGLPNGFYIVSIRDGEFYCSARLIIIK